jgi:hypothetical protein
MHIEELVGLPEPIPRTVVLPIHVYGTAIRFNCRMRVLHLDVFVAHECPSGEVCPIKLRSTPKVSNGLFMLSSQGVVVPYPFPQVALLFREGEGGNVPTRQHTSGRSLSRARKSCASLESVRRFSVTYSMLE